LRKIILFILFSTYCILANAQANERYPIIFSQFYIAPALINPALLQSTYKLNVTASNQFHRAPFNQIRTAIFDADMRVSGNRSKNSTIIGVTFVNDREGSLLNYTRAAMRYGIHIPLSEKIHLSGGASAGIVNLSIDQTVSSGTISSFAPDLSLGIAIYSKSTWLGFSSSQVTNSALQSDITKIRLPRFYIVYIKKEFEISPFFKLIPSGIVRIRNAYYNPILWDVNVGALLQTNLLIGSGYSNSLGLNFNVSLYEYYFISNPLSIVFSYNTGIGNQVNAKIESFELTIRYSFLNKTREEISE
jgi:type IX secretion system PorP/SprF family membrane protein